MTGIVRSRKRNSHWFKLLKKQLKHHEIPSMLLSVSFPPFFLLLTFILKVSCLFPSHMLSLSSPFPSLSHSSFLFPFSSFSSPFI